MGQSASDKQAGLVNQISSVLKQEKNTMLVLDDIASQMQKFDHSLTKYDKIIDLIKVCENLPQANLSVKQSQKHWDQFRRRLREFNRKESEFISMTRSEVV
jgi:hypothetical protein